tara:strand:+ start:610 stop:1374 length:765 start_codon:yes stop_codon:yes gene_type:complete
MDVLYSEYRICLTYDIVKFKSRFKTNMKLVLSPAWLDAAWYGTAKFKQLPRLYVQGTTLSVVAFRAGGVGMRVRTCTIGESGQAGLEVPDALRAFIKQCAAWDTVTLVLKDDTLAVIAETASSVVHYTFSGIEQVPGVAIESDSRDVDVRLTTREWLNVYATLPHDGTVCVMARAHKRAITLKHSGGRWVAGTTAAEPVAETVTFYGQSNTMKFVFRGDALASMSTLTFMHCGVLRWQSGTDTIYIAPYEPTNS